VTNFFDDQYADGEQNLTIRKGDRLPTFIVQILGEFNDPIDLTGCRAFGSLRRVSSGEGGSAWGGGIEMLVLDSVQGIVSYDWQEFDTAFAFPGKYEISIVLRDAVTGQQKFTVPTERNTYIDIRSSVVDSDLYRLATPLPDGLLFKVPFVQGGQKVLLPITRGVSS
jgi:hypothetical protein